MKNNKPINVEEQLIRKYERVSSSVYDSPTAGSKWIAGIIADLIKDKAKGGLNYFSPGSGPVQRPQLCYGT